MSPAAKLAFLASATAPKELKRLKAIYGNAPLARADVIVALGGDGAMLNAVHRVMEKGLTTPIYGMNCGSIGFLMNRYSKSELTKRLKKAIATKLAPLKMVARNTSGKTLTALAVNEVSMLRQTHQSAHIKVKVDGKVRMENLVADGILIATPAGSTAYNLSASGPVVPLGSGVLAVTAISPYRPRRWRGALVAETSQITLRVKDPKHRPVSVSADSAELRNVSEVKVSQHKAASFTLLFDPSHALEERITAEQWSG